MWSLWVKIEIYVVVSRWQANYLIIDYYLCKYFPSGRRYLYFDSEWPPPRESSYLTEYPQSIKTRNFIKQRGRISYPGASNCKRRHSAANDRGCRKPGRSVESPPLLLRLKGRADGGLFLFSSLINDFGKSSFQAKVFSFSKSRKIEFTKRRAAVEFSD